MLWPMPPTNFTLKSSRSHLQVYSRIGISGENTRHLLAPFWLFSFVANERLCSMHACMHAYTTVQHWMTVLLLCTDTPGCRLCCSCRSAPPVSISASSVAPPPVNAAWCTHISQSHHACRNHHSCLMHCGGSAESRLYRLMMPSWPAPSAGAPISNPSMAAIPCRYLPLQRQHPRVRPPLSRGRVRGWAAWQTSHLTGQISWV